MISTLITSAATTASASCHALRWRPRLRSRRDLRVLLYHGIGDRSHPALSGLYDEISADAFARQLDFLQARYDILPLHEAIWRSQQRDAPQRPLCAITFDDGLRSVYTHAYPILRERGLTATSFVNTSVIDSGRWLWQHRLSHALATYGLPALWPHIAAELDWSDTPATAYDVIVLAHVRFREFRPLLPWLESLPLPASDQYVTWAQIAEMAPTVATASHTARHVPLAAVDHETMRAEIDDARRLVPERDVLSFPFGMLEDFGAESRLYALTRHAYVCAVEDGWNPARRVARTRTIHRVCLGSAIDPVELDARLEWVPALKGRLNRWRRAAFSRRASVRQPRNSANDVVAENRAGGQTPIPLPEPPRRSVR
jgi:peptidoglycan/xylan/chitin deacetylase (PgdA/CDA1 family)